jgi:membrane-associated phospholipid phosphatase
MSLTSFIQKHVANESQVQNIVKLQRATGYHTDKPPTALGWKMMNLFFEAISVTATGVVFILLFPFWFSLGQPKVTTHLCLLMSCAQVCTSLIKDVVQLMRPPFPPVVRIGGDNYKKEYSFPSGHSSGALLLAYCNTKYAVSQFGADPLLCYSLGVLYVISVGFSRIYLGMHWQKDVLAGVAIGTVIAISHHYGVEQFLDSFVLNSDYLLPFNAIGSFVIGLSIVIFFHPTPAVACPCYLDTARFVGAALGAIFGVLVHGVAASPVEWQRGNSMNWWYATPTHIKFGW